MKIFPVALSNTLIEQLEKEGFEDKVIELVQYTYENYRDNKEAALWFFKEKEPIDWLEQANINYEKQLLTLIHVLQTCYREIANQQNTPENRKISRHVENALFRDPVIDDFIDTADQDSITRVYTLIDDVEGLDGAIKMKIRNKILKRFPKFKFYGTEERAFVTRGLLVTQSKMVEKQKQLQHILDVEVPENSKEISDALALGDLRENAEYKAAKEKQDQLNTTVARLKDELDRAEIFDPSLISTNRVSFGTMVALRNETEKKDEEYTILGPWESNPEKGIISYLSPFGASLMNKKLKERFAFQIEGVDLTYTVTSISSAKIE